MVDDVLYQYPTLQKDNILLRWCGFSTNLLSTWGILAKFMRRSCFEVLKKRHVVAYLIFEEWFCRHATQIQGQSCAMLMRRCSKELDLSLMITFKAILLYEMLQLCSNDC